MCILVSDLWRRTVDLQSWSRTGLERIKMTGTLWSALAWSVSSSAEVSVHVSLHFLVLNNRRDKQTNLRTAASWKLTLSSKQQKKEQCRLSKRSHMKIVMAKLLRQRPPKACTCMWCLCIAGDVGRLPVPCLGTFASVHALPGHACSPCLGRLPVSCLGRLPVPCLRPFASALPGHVLHSLPGTLRQFPAWERLPMPCLGMFASPCLGTL